MGLSFGVFQLRVQKIFCTTLTPQPKVKFPWILVCGVELRIKFTNKILIQETNYSLALWMMLSATRYVTNNSFEKHAIIRVVNVIEFYGGNFEYLFWTVTPWSRVFPEKLQRPKLLKKFPAFYGTRKFITVFIKARHLSLSWVRLIQSISPLPASQDPF
jgi:hypothetical protein